MPRVTQRQAGQSEPDTSSDARVVLTGLYQLAVTLASFSLQGAGTFMNKKITPLNYGKPLPSVPGDLAAPPLPVTSWCGASSRWQDSRKVALPPSRNPEGSSQGSGPSAQTEK